jgi:hypothetical protein
VLRHSGQERNCLKWYHIGSVSDTFAEPWLLIIFWGGGGEGPRSRSYGSTAALKLIVQTCDEDKQISFLFFQVMEHQWNEIDRDKPKYSGKNLSQCHFANHKSHTN